jgi:hypothetical protein
VQDEQIGLVFRREVEREPEPGPRAPRKIDRGQKFLYLFHKPSLLAEYVDDDTALLGVYEARMIFP